MVNRIYPVRQSLQTFSRTPQGKDRTDRYHCSRLIINFLNNTQKKTSKIPCIRHHLQNHLHNHIFRNRNIGDQRKQKHQKGHKGHQNKEGCLCGKCAHMILSHAVHESGHDFYELFHFVFLSAQYLFFTYLFLSYYFFRNPASFLS